MVWRRRPCSRSQKASTFRERRQGKRRVRQVKAGGVQDGVGGRITELSRVYYGLKTWSWEQWGAPYSLTKRMAWSNYPLIRITWLRYGAGIQGGKNNLPVREHSGLHRWKYCAHWKQKQLLLEVKTDYSWVCLPEKWHNSSAGRRLFFWENHLHGTCCFLSLRKFRSLTWLVQAGWVA